MFLILILVSVKVIILKLIEILKFLKNNSWVCFKELRLVVNVNKNLIVNITLVILAIILIVSYAIYVIIDERKNGKWESFSNIEFIMKYIISYIWIWLRKWKKYFLRSCVQLYDWCWYSTYAIFRSIGICNLTILFAFI